MNTPKIATPYPYAHREVEVPGPYYPGQRVLKSATAEFGSDFRLKGSVKPLMALAFAAPTRPPGVSKKAWQNGGKGLLRVLSRI